MKPSIVFIHGFCEDSRIWKHLNIQNIDVHSIDLPGYGKSNDIPFRSIKDMADYVLKQINALNLEHVIVIGHSLGGYVTMEMMKTNPDFVKGIGLIHSHPFEDDEQRLKTRRKLIQFIDNNGLNIFLKTFYPSLFYRNNVQQYQSIINDVYLNDISFSKESVIQSLEAMMERRDYISVLKNIKIPVWVLAGKHDESISLSDSLKMACMPDYCQFNLLQNSGHAGFYEEQELFEQYLNDFLSLIK